MDVIKQYLSKHGKVGGSIWDDPREDLEIIIVIPAYKEEGILKTLGSLRSCIQPTCAVEIIVLVNGSQKDDGDVVRVNQECYQVCLEAQGLFESNNRRLHVLKDLDLPLKKVGVGLARKILMDEAAWRLGMVGKPNGVIVNLDADCTVEKNYLLEIKAWFDAHPKLDAGSIHFEHEVDGPPILNYELHLRYFIGMQKQIGLPFAFQTIGSAMASRAVSYAKVGGMNTRQAGEDFYFLHKFIKNDRCGKITCTTIFPSGRQSDRVPFGTGRAVGEMKKGIEFKTYNYNSFSLLKQITVNLPVLFAQKKVNFDKNIGEYLKSIDFEAHLKEITLNTTNFESFTKRFYQYFDAFKLMKCLHYLRDIGFHDSSLEEALPHYFDDINLEFKGVSIASLQALRQFDKSGNPSVGPL